MVTRSSPAIDRCDLLPLVRADEAVHSEEVRFTALEHLGQGQPWLKVEVLIQRQQPEIVAMDPMAAWWPWSSVT